MQAAPSKAVKSKIADAVVGGRTLSFDRRYVWLALSTLIFAVSTTVALTQAPRRDPLQAVPLLSTEWWLHPVERNAFKRLANIGGAIQAIHAHKDGQRLWVVGSGGLIAHSSDGGRSWTQQKWTAPAATGEEPLTTQAPPDDGKSVPPKQAPADPPKPVPDSKLRQIQDDLKTLGFYRGASDGFESGALREAISAFQKSRGIAPDGLPGAQTRSELDKALKEYPSPKQEQKAPPPAKNRASNSLFDLGFLVPEAQAAPVRAAGGETPPAATATREAKQPAEATHALNGIYFLSDAVTGWAVGEGGTILHTADGGSTWETQTSKTTAGLHSVAFADARSGWIVGRDGTILHTLDGGATWEPQISTTDSLVSVAFADARTAWAVGGYGTILHTADGGATWKQQTSKTTETLFSVAIVDARSGWTVGDKGTILHTADGGATWEAQTSKTTENLLSVAIVDARSGWIVGGGGTILHTANGGVTWDQENSQTAQFLAAVAFPDGRNGWIVDLRGAILHTADAGATWESQTSQQGFRVAFPGERTGWIVSDNGTILHTADGGARWEPQNTRDADVNGVWFADARTGWIVGGGGTILHTADGGMIWVPQSSKTTEALIAVSFADTRTGWIVGGGGTILHTADGGATWEPQNSKTAETLSAVSFGNARSGWIIGGGGTILHTADGGATWEPQDSKVAELLNAVWFADARTGWIVARGGTILHTADGGGTWEPQNSKTTETLVAVWFADARIGWIVGGGGTILHTSDGGATWEQQVGKTHRELISVSFADTRTGWIAGLGGTILHTNDGGETWLGGENGPPIITYARYPAPWWYLSLVCGLLTVSIALRPPLPVAQPTASVADLALSDKPIDVGDRDALAFRPIALGLSNFLRNAATQPPLTLAITGDWGSGKSSLMNLLRADLRERGFRPVWFNAWHQQKDASLLGALVSSIRLQALPPHASIEGLRFRMQLLGERIRERPLTTAAMMFAATFATTYVLIDPAHFSNLLQWLPLVGVALTDEKGDATKSLLEQFKSFAVLAAVLGPIFTALNGLRAFGLKPSSLATSLAGSLKQTSAQAQFLHDYARQFRDVTRALDPRTLTIFIDDLDRCTPERVRETLEAVNYLVSSGPCFIVLGMARERVEACVGIAFKDIAQEMVDLSRLDGGDEPISTASSEDAASRHRRRYARDYLKKLVNIEVQVPQPTDVQTRGLVGVSSASASGSTHESKAPSIFTVTAAAFRKLAFSGFAHWPWALLLLMATVGWWAASRTPDLGAPPKPAPQAAVTADVGKEPSGVTAPNGKSATPPPPASEARAAYVVPGQIASKPVLVWLVPIILLAAAGAVVLLRRPNVVERDSVDFRDALANWLPLVSARQNTPREVKRYVNRVRLLAMRQRAEGDGVEGLDEHALVALGALLHVDESLLEPLPVPGSGATAGARLTAASHLWGGRIAKPLDTAIQEHLKIAAWPPPPEAVRRFRDLAGGMRLS